MTRAGLHATSLHERLFQNLKLLHIQLDELCTKTRQGADALWVWFALDARTKTIPVLKVGPRTQPTCPPQRSGVGMAHAVVHALVGVLASDGLPVFTSDGLKLYVYALTAHFGNWVQTAGRPTHQWQVRAGLLYGQLVKHYTCPHTPRTAQGAYGGAGAGRWRRLVRVQRRAVLGSLDPPAA